MFLLATLEEPGNVFSIEAYGGSGDIMLTLEGVQLKWNLPMAGVVGPVWHGHHHV